MKIVVVKPFKKPYIAEIDGSLKSMQSVVRGYIEIVYPFSSNPEIALVCNEEGKLDELTPNRYLYNSNLGIYDCICGDFFLCLAPPESENLQSLTDELADKLIRKFS